MFQNYSINSLCTQIILLNRCSVKFFQFQTSLSNIISFFSSTWSYPWFQDLRNLLFLFFSNDFHPKRHFSHLLSYNIFWRLCSLDFLYFYFKWQQQRTDLIMTYSIFFFFNLFHFIILIFKIPTRPTEFFLFIIVLSNRI